MAKDKISKEDSDLFRRSVSDARLIHSNKVILRGKKVKAKPIRREDAEAMEEIGLSDIIYEASVTGEQQLHFSRSGIQTKVMRRMKHGDFEIEATLDLHGMIINEARHSVLSFIRMCLENGYRHVLIIHGKGRATDKPVLKNQINHCGTAWCQG